MLKTNDMRSIFIGIIIASMALLKTASSQTTNSIISFVKTAHDFGAIKEDVGKVSVDFEFSNSGNSPLIIQRVVSSCDCAVVDWPKEPLIPGAIGKIKVVFNPINRPGAFDKLVTVYSNAQAPSVLLMIKGSVLARTKTIEEVYSRQLGDFRFKNTHAAFGRVFANDIKLDTIEFICIASATTKIGAKVVGMPHLFVKFIPESLNPQEKGIMIVKFDAKMKNDWGFVIDRFYLTQNNQDISGSMINVSASIEENFTALTDAQRVNSPKIELLEQNYEFGEVNEGQLLEKEFVFENIGKGDLIIRKIKPSCGCTTVEPAEKLIKPGKRSSVKASFRTNGFSGKVAKTITIITNDPVNPSVVIRMVGSIIPSKK